MANKKLFGSLAGKLLPNANTVNEAGGSAHDFGADHALAQLAATGCFNGTYYVSAGAQLESALALAVRVDTEMLAKAAVYARRRAHMKDMPALLLAVLSARDPKRFAQVFDRVIDNGRMLRTFVQIMRSGATGRKSLGTRPKKQILAWLEKQSDEYLFKASVGSSPSLADVLKMVHPKPATATRRALYGYLIGRKHDADALPELTKQLEAYKADRSGEMPNLPFQMLTALELGTAQWTEIARNASWQMTRMNLNTFARHGVFDVDGMAELLAVRLRDPELVKKARVFPYQLLSAYKNVGDRVPRVVRDALQVAMEHSIGSIPELDGHVVVCPDVSGSMSSPVTGYRKGATSVVRCIDVAALIAAAVLRRNPLATVLPFHGQVVPIELNGRDSVMTNANRLASIGGGATVVSAPLAKLNADRASADLVVFVSDNQSWVDSRSRGATQTMIEWARLKSRSPNARMVCIDVQPYTQTQAPDREDILNVGGFSDQVFDVLASFAKGSDGESHWTDVIRSIEL